MLPVYNPADHLPPPANLFPTLRLSPDANRDGQYRAHLTRTLVQQLRLTANQPIDLLPPSSHHNWWHLDLRAAAKNRLRWYADTRPRIHGLILPDGLLGTEEALTLRLVPGDPAFPGYYPLLPDAYFTQHTAPALAARPR